MKLLIMYFSQFLPLLYSSMGVTSQRLRAPAASLSSSTIISQRIHKCEITLL